MRSGWETLHMATINHFDGRDPITNLPNPPTVQTDLPPLEHLEGLVPADRLVALKRYQDAYLKALGAFRASKPEVVLGAARGNGKEAGIAYAKHPGLLFTAHGSANDLYIDALAFSHEIRSSERTGKALERLLEEAAKATEEAFDACITAWLEQGRAAAYGLEDVALAAAERYGLLYSVNEWYLGKPWTGVAKVLPADARHAWLEWQQLHAPDPSVKLMKAPPIDKRTPRVPIPVGG